MAGFDEIIADVQALLKQSPQVRRGKLTVSPEFAAWLSQAPAGDSMPSAPASVADLSAAADSHDREAALAALAREVAACTQCALCESRKQTVFSDGSPFADVVFVGEAPGADEDAQGVPFVGRAGQLLTRIIERVMRLKREDVYICNVLKCRPPGNRDPEASEKAACLPYLSQQLALVRPKVIVALGRHAANTLLKTDEPTGRLRERWHSYDGIPLRVTYHPAYILRCEGDKEKERTEKAKVKADIDEVMRVLSGEIVPIADGHASQS